MTTSDDAGRMAAPLLFMIEFQHQCHDGIIGALQSHMEAEMMILQAANNVVLHWLFFVSTHYKCMYIYYKLESSLGEIIRSLGDKAADGFCDAL